MKARNIISEMLEFLLKEKGYKASINPGMGYDTINVRKNNKTWCIHIDGPFKEYIALIKEYDHTLGHTWPKPDVENPEFDPEKLCDEIISKFFDKDVEELKILWTSRQFI